VKAVDAGFTRFAANSIDFWYNIDAIKHANSFLRDFPAAFSSQSFLPFLQENEYSRRRIFPTTQTSVARSFTSFAIRRYMECVEPNSPILRLGKNPKRVRNPVDEEEHQSGTNLRHGARIPGGLSL
jgi:hypothetical protein